MKKQKIYQLLTLFFFLQLAFIALISKYPQVVENYYSNGIYPYISSVFRSVIGWIPFSFGDVFYFLLGVFLIISVYKCFKGGLKELKNNFFKLGALVSVLYFLFHFLWGINYHRDSLYNSLQLEQEEYTLDDLVYLSQDLLQKTKKVHLQITDNDTIKVAINSSKEDIFNQVQSGYNNLDKILPRFNYQNKSLKKSLFSLPLTYIGFSGYFNPFSGEAQVDYLVPKPSLPMITSHEVAHQLGYASESEANFIGFLAATQSDQLYYKYSAYLTALRYAVGATYGKDSIVGRQLIDSIPKGIIKNIKESQEFWRSYQNKAEPFFKLFYDNYLKANQQQDGIKGYSNMVGLLVAYRKKYGLP